MSTVDETGLAGEPPEGGLTTEPKKRFTDSAAFAWLQKFGKSLMLPIAVLPAAALLTWAAVRWPCPWAHAETAPARAPGCPACGRRGGRVVEGARLERVYI